MKNNPTPGSVFRRPDGDKWIGRRRWTSELGLRCERSFTCDSEKEAWRKLAAFNKELIKGLVVASAEPTFGEWLSSALEVIYKPKVRPSTFRLYEGFVKNHLSLLGKVKLNSLTVDMLEEFINNRTMTKMRKVEGKAVYETLPLSAQSKAHLRRFTIGVLKHAIRKGKLKENVAEKTVLKSKTSKRRIHALNLSQLQVLLAKTTSPNMKAIFACQAMAGLRIGEVLGLKWSDFKGNVVQIVRQIQRVKTDDGSFLVEQELKTEQSRRAITFIVPLMALVTALPKKGPYVFCSKSGGPLEPRNVQRALYKAAELAELENVSTHVLRHTYATLMVQQGTDLVIIKEALGHTDLRTTTIYAEAQVETIRAANEKLEKLFG